MRTNSSISIAAPRPRRLRLRSATKRMSVAIAATSILVATPQLASATPRAARAESAALATAKPATAAFTKAKPPTAAPPTTAGPALAAPTGRQAPAAAPSTGPITPPATPVVRHTASAAAAAAPAVTPALPGLPAPASLLPPLPAVACPLAPNQIGALVCAIGTVGYAYKTVYTTPGGAKVARTTSAVLGVPTLIDVDGDGLPDLLGTITVSTGLNGLTLSINRLPTFSAAARASVEAILTNPTAAQSYAGIGYDGTAAGTPQGFSATLSLVSLTAGAAELALSVSTSAPPPSLGIVGELFQSDRDNPIYIQRGVVGFAPVPSSVAADLKFQPAHLEASITTSASSLATPQLHMTSPGREQDVDVSIDQLPQSVDLAYDNANTLTYAGSAPIKQLGVAYHDYVNKAIATAAGLDASGVPTGITVGFGTQLSVQTSGGAIALVEARLGQGVEMPPTRPGSTPYGAYHKSVSTTTAGARIANLSALKVNLAGPYGVDLTLTAPLAQLDLSAQDDAQGVSATARLSNLPSHATMNADLVAGQLSFDGHGTAISAIALHATKSTPFFARATRIDLTAADVPSSEILNFSQQPNGVSATATAAIGQLNLAATDGADAPPVPAPYADYASFSDQPTRYLIVAVVNGFLGASFNYNPAVGTIGGAFDVLQRQVLGLEAHVAAGDFRGSIDQLPNHVDFSLGTGPSGARVATVNAAQAISKITISGSNLALPSSFPATSLNATFADVPPHLALTIPASGGSFAFSATAADGKTPATIGEIYFQAWQRDLEQSLAADAVNFDDRPGEFRAAIDLAGLQAFSFNPTSYGGSITTVPTAAHDLTADVFHGAQTLHSTVHSLPATLSFSLASDANGNEVVDYAASSIISQIILTTSGLGALHLPLGATNVSLQVDNLPGHVTLTIPTSAGTLKVDLHGDHAGDVIAQVYGPGGPGPTTRSGHQELVYDEQHGQIAAALYQVGSFSATTTLSPETTSYDISPMPLDYRYQKADGTYIAGTISNPQPATIVVDPDVGHAGNVRLEYTAEGPVNSITVSTNAAGSVNATIEQVPEHLSACINPTGYLVGGVSRCLAGTFRQSSTAIPPFDTAGLCIVPPFESCATEYPIVPATLAFQFFPTDKHGNPPAEPISVSGDFCPHNNPADCVYNGPARPEVVHFDHLRLGTLQLAIGSGQNLNPGETSTGNQNWVGFDTGATPLTGFLSYSRPGDTHPYFIFSSDASQGGSFRSQGFMLVLDNPGGVTQKSYRLLGGCVSYTQPTSASVNFFGYKNILGLVDGFAC